MIAQLSDGRYIKADRIEVIDRDEFETRWDYAERTGQALPFDWTPNEPVHAGRV